jgi:hypothetical protein
MIMKGFSRYHTKNPSQHQNSSAKITLLGQMSGTRQLTALSGPGFPSLNAAGRGWESADLDELATRADGQPAFGASVLPWFGYRDHSRTGNRPLSLLDRAG